MFLILFFFQIHSFIKKSEMMQVDFAGWVCQVAGL